MVVVQVVALQQPHLATLVEEQAVMLVVMAKASLLPIR